MKGEVPGGEPGIFPLVRHRNYMIADHVEPLAVANLAGRGLHWVGIVFHEPFIGMVKEILLAPQHPRQRLSHDIGRVLACGGRCYRPIKLVSLVPARLYDLIKFLAKPVPRYRVAQPQPDDSGLANRDLELIVRCRLCPGLGRIDSVLPARHDIVVDAILDVGGRVRTAKDPLIVRIVFGEQEARIAVAMQHEAAELGMRGFDREGVLSWPLSQGWLWLVGPPGPRVAKPQGRQYVQRRRLWAAIAQADQNQNVG